MDSSEETNCQAPEGPILCVNNCGFFGSAATMNMCSKCHKEIVMEQERAKLAISSIEGIMNEGSCSKTGNNPVFTSSVDQLVPAEAKVELAVTTEVQAQSLSFGNSSGEPPKEGPKRCTTCRKRVGLTGFNCRCGSLFCASHRYSDKHDCPFDYQTAGRDAIARANPVVKAEKLDKI